MIYLRGTVRYVDFVKTGKLIGSKSVTLTVWQISALIAPILSSRDHACVARPNDGDASADYHRGCHRHCPSSLTSRNVAGDAASKPLCDARCCGLSGSGQIVLENVSRGLGKLF